MIRSLFRAALALCALASLGQALPARADSGWTANADDALLFEVRLGKYRVGDGVRGYATPGGVCVDFADTLLALDIPVRLDKKSGRATGWAFDERHTLTIDRVSGEEHITNNGVGTNGKVAPHDIYDTKEGWCVDTRALSRWLGATFVADSANAVLVVKSDHKLPPEAAAERRERASHARPDASFDLAALPQSKVTLPGLRPPSVDVVASVGGLSDRARGRRVDAQYEIFAAGVVGKVAYNARLSSSPHGVPESVRVQAYRTDPAGGLLGPLHATTVAIGDVTGLSTALVSASSIGRGAFVTNRPVERSDRFDRIDLRGALPRGWDAELYRNGQLIAFAQDRADGRYEFLDVVLQYGTNRFEIVLYGPQGQVRREVKSVPVGLDSIPPRRTLFWAGVDEDGRDLIDLRRGPVYGPGGWRGSLALERGIDARTSVAAYAHSLRLDGTRYSFLELLGRRALGGALVEASGSLALDGGKAGRVQVVGETGTTRYDIETIWADGYRSDRFQRDVTGTHSATVDRVFGNGRGAVPVTLTARLTTRRTGTDTIDVASRISAMLGRIAITGEVGWRRDLLAGQRPSDAMTAALLANARIGRVRLRGEARWRVVPEAKLDSATLVGEWTAGHEGQIADRQAASWRAELGYDRALARARAGLGYVRRFDRFALTATGEVASDGSVAAGLNVAFSFGPDPRSGRSVRVVADKLAARASALVRVYRDVNANGRHDVGEPWAQNVAITAGRTPVDLPTDARGEAVVDGLEPYQPVLIGIDGGALPDPNIRPSTPGLVVTPSPGLVAVVELPLVGTGDIDGTLVRQGGGPLPGVELELVTGSGVVVARTRSDFDGFFLFDTVPYGQYRVRIARLDAEAVRAATALAAQAEVSERKASTHLGAVAAMPVAAIVLMPADTFPRHSRAGGDPAPEPATGAGSPPARE